MKIVSPIGQRFASWAHPLWLKEAGVCRIALSTEAAELDWAGDFVFGTDYGHGYDSAFTYADGAQVETSVGNDFTDHESLQNSNTNHPLTDAAWWTDLTQTGLGADDAMWGTISGVARITRFDAAGDYTVHFQGAASGVSGAYWNQQFTAGQWCAISGAGGVVSPTVRQSATSDTCYYFIGIPDEFNEWVTAEIYKCIDGVSTLLGTGYIANDANYDTTLMRICAYGNTIAVECSTYTIDNDEFLNKREYVRVAEVTDTSISTATGPYVGVRFWGTGQTHEMYGGGFEVPYISLPTVYITTTITSSFLVGNMSGNLTLSTASVISTITPVSLVGHMSGSLALPTVSMTPVITIISLIGDRTGLIFMPSAVIPITTVLDSLVGIKTGTKYYNGLEWAPVILKRNNGIQWITI